MTLELVAKDWVEEEVLAAFPSKELGMSLTFIPGERQTADPIPLILSLSQDERLICTTNYSAFLETALQSFVPTFKSSDRRVDIVDRDELYPAMDDQ